MTPTLPIPKSAEKILLKCGILQDHPLIYSGYFSDKGEDMEVMLESNFVRNSSKPQLSRNNPQLIKLPLQECQKFEYQSDSYWDCALTYLDMTLYHPPGTCLMGTSDKKSVVDPRLRVQGI